MKQIIWHEIKRNFVWWKIFLLIAVFVLSAGYLFTAFVLYPEKPIEFHPGMYKITFLGGLNIAVFVACCMSGFGLAVFFGEAVSLYRYYKQQIDEMTSKGKTPVV